MRSWFRRNSRSLRWRIQIWHALILAILVTAFVTVIYLNQRWTRFREIDQELSAAVEVLLSQLELENTNDVLASNLSNLRMPATFAPRRFRHSHEAPYFVIWDRDNVPFGSPNPHAETAYRPNEVSVASGSQPASLVQREVMYVSVSNLAINGLL